MHVFIVRPFGTKNGIDFDGVETRLIRPAMQQAGLSGGTTGELLQQGNIRTDMFEQLLIADVVIADISMHNANVFYELGIRHALRDKHTFLINSQGADVPFDLKTDRYLSYDATNPAASVAALGAALKATMLASPTDSPVYQLLPELEPPDADKFLVIPLDFREAVERAEAARNGADLQLLAAELDGFAWRAAGLRLVGKAQFRLRDWPGARATWNAVRQYNEMDVEANTMLGTVFQRLDDLVSSDQAVERALQNRSIAAAACAETRALMGHNAKTRWVQSWPESVDLEALQKAALTSPHLEKSFELYAQGFVEDRNHFYSGLNALAMVTMLTQLAQAQPTVWEDGFDTKDEAAQKLHKLTELRAELRTGVKLAIESRQVVLQRCDQTDIWADISAADLTFLSSTRPGRVSAAYTRALTDAPEQTREAARRQLLLYQRLGILPENTQAALASMTAPMREPTGPEAAPRVLMFTGHRVDAPNRPTPRFPAAREPQARQMIYQAVAQEHAKAHGKLLGISGGASGGDILFHEVCEELGIPSRMYLVLPKHDYVKASVADGGAAWVERFQRLYDKLQPKTLGDSEELPHWLRSKPGYSIWQRSNLWMLHHALYISQDHLTLIALWNGSTGDGPGGTADMVQRAQDRGATFIHLDARILLG